jgi:hypothetical protein
VQRLPLLDTGPDSGAPAAVGGAIEWAIGLDLADTVPYGDVFEMVAARKPHASYRPPISKPAVGSSADSRLRV